MGWLIGGTRVGGGIGRLVVLGLGGMGRWVG